MKSKKKNLTISFLAIFIISCALIYKLVNQSWQDYQNLELKLSFRHPPTWSQPTITPLSTKTIIEFSEINEPIFSLTTGVQFDQDLQRTLDINELKKNLSNSISAISDYQNGKLIGFSYNSSVPGQNYFVETTVFLADQNDLTNLYIFAYRHKGDKKQVNGIPKTLDSLISSFTYNF